MFVRIRSTNRRLRDAMDLKGIPHLLEGRKAEIFKHCAMSVDIDRFDRPNGAARIKSQEDKPCYVIASNDLELLWECLLISHNGVTHFLQRYIFRIRIHRMFDDVLCKNPAQNSPQRRLLEPFTVLHSVPHCEIAGPANTEYCASIATRISRMPPTAEDRLDEVTKMMDKGREETNLENFEGALKIYKMTLHRLFSTCKLFRTDPTLVHTGKHFDSMNIHLDLLFSFAFLHYKLNEFEDAHFWACHVLKCRVAGLMRHEDSYAITVYIKAIASVRLGEHHRAVEELCEGLKAVSREAYKHNALIELRNEAKHHLQALGGIKLFRAMGCLDAFEIWCFPRKD